MEQKVVLPPISTLTCGMPVLSLDINSKTNIPVLPLTSQVQLNPNYLKGKPTTFSSLEDISILKAMRLYLGNNISLKIPWSFWQVYRRFTGSQRSDSSLYHHWNGAMVKKYGNFIKDGRIDECIRWAESALEMVNGKLEKEEEDKMVGESRPLIHTQSHQVLTSELFRMKQSTEPAQQSARSLVHFQSLQDIDLLHLKK